MPSNHPLNGKIVQASFYWQNDRPGGIGFTFGPPAFTPHYLTDVFETGPEIKRYFLESDKALGSNVVKDYFAQLKALGQTKDKGGIPIEQAFLAALNILWLTRRGFLPNDEYNGYQFIRAVQ